MKLPTDQVLQQGVTAHNEGKLQEAEILYRSILKTHPTHPDANYNLGIIAVSMNKIIEALTLFKTAIQTNPNIEQYWISYTAALIDEKQFEEAEIGYKKLLELNPNFVEVHNNLGSVLKNLGRLDEAETSYRKAIKLKPDYAEAYNNLGITLKDLDRLDEAEISYNQAIELQPDHAEAYYNLAVILGELGRLEEAETSYKKAIELKPDFIDAYNNLGNMQQKIGRLDEAEANYRKAIELKPDSFVSYNNLGNTIKEIGNVNEAIANYRKSIELNPGFAEAHYNLGLILYEQGKFKEAIEEFKLNDFKSSKEFLLTCLFKTNEKTLFYEQLDYLIKRGDNNALIGSLVSSSEIRYGINKPNPFCNDPLDHILHTNLTESCNFETTFIKTIKDNLNNDTTSHKKKQILLTKGDQTVGNMFSQKSLTTDEIQKILRLEIEKYRTHFKNSEEGFLKNWPNNYDLNGWLINMKSGGSLSAHMHENGWVSGSVYINVPPKLKADSGNLVVCIDNENNREENKKSIDVVTGSLCLFPSSLHHYTIPFESNEERIVLAFDVIPK